MKLSNEYWYNHSTTSTAKSPLRLAIVKPCGVFVVDGKPLARCSQRSDTGNLEIDETSKISIKAKSSFPSVKYSPQKHYSRLDTPLNEKEEDMKRSERENRVKQYKQIYFDNNYVKHPIRKSKTFDIFLPAKASMDTFESTFKGKVGIEK